MEFRNQPASGTAPSGVKETLLKTTFPGQFSIYECIYVHACKYVHPHTHLCIAHDMVHTSKEAKPPHLENEVDPILK